MSQSLYVADKSYMAAANFAGKRFHGVVLSAEQTVNIAGAGASIDGVLQDEPTVAGQAARVRDIGSSIVKAGAAFAAGAKLTTNAAGRFVAAGGGAEFSMKAVEAATADGDEVEANFATGTA